MASIETRTLSDNTPSYRVVWRADGKRHHSPFMSNKVEAQLYQTMIERDMDLNPFETLATILTTLREIQTEVAALRPAVTTSDLGKSSWVWYCDVHDTYGQADTEGEAQAVAAAHEEFFRWAEVEEGDGPGPTPAEHGYDNDSPCDLMIMDLRTSPEGGPDTHLDPSKVSALSDIRRQLK